MEVTKREILVSIIIFFILISLGLIIHNFIIEKYILSIEKYNKALKIDNDKELFNYAIDTEVGNILVYGTFESADKVSLEELKKDYMYIEKIKQEYTQHTREVCSIDSDGKTHCHTEVYYEWDDISSQSYTSQEIMFLEKNFRYSTFSGYQKNRLSLKDNVIDKYNSYIYDNYLYEKKPTFWGSSVGDIRYYYIVSPLKFTGTIFAKANNKTILNENKGKIQIYDSNLEETIENKKSYSTVIAIIFWIIWIFLTGLAIYGYVYLDNNYLED